VGEPADEGPDDVGAAVPAGLDGLGWATPLDGDEGAAAGCGETGRGADAGAETSFSFSFDGWLISARILSTVVESRLAKALTLTSRPHFWILSSSSGLFSPSSLASS
jgi:hypothetical protein